MIPIALTQPLTHAIINVEGGSDYVFIFGKNYYTVIYSPNSVRFETLLPPGEYWVIALKKRGALFSVGAVKLTFEGESVETSITLKRSSRCAAPPEAVFTIWIYGAPHALSICNGDVAVMPLLAETTGEGGFAPLGAPKVKAPEISEYAREQRGGFPTSLGLLLIAAFSTSLIAYIVAKRLAGIP